MSSSLAFLTHQPVIPFHSLGCSPKTHTHRIVNPKLHHPARRLSRSRLQPRAEADSDPNTTPNSEDTYVETTRIPEADALSPESNSEIIAPTFNLAGAFLFFGGASFYAGDGWILLGLPLTAIGILLSVQTFRVRFLFGPSKLSIATKSSEGLNIIVGWDYAQITNWEVWWPFLPTLAYFKEKESYAGRGSIHFFPVVCDGKMLIQALRRVTPHLDKKDYE